MDSGDPDDTSIENEGFLERSRKFTRAASDKDKDNTVNLQGELNHDLRQVL